jgi:hypothetical protein
MADKLERLLQLWLTRDGLDMSSKLLQYLAYFIGVTTGKYISCCFVRQVTHLNVATGNADLATSSLALARGISSSRSWMRLGREIPELQFAYKKVFLQRRTLSIIDMMLVFVALASAAYFITDHISWLISIGAIWWLNATFWDDASSWCWLLGLVVCLFVDTIRAIENPHARSSNHSKPPPPNRDLSLPPSPTIGVFIRNLGDLTVALAITGMVNFPDAIVGAGGLVAAAVALYHLWG